VLHRQGPLRILQRTEEAVKPEKTAVAESLARLRNLATWIRAFANLREPAAPPLGSANVLCGAGSQRKGPKELRREAWPPGQSWEP
jgi:hypothetical protein